MYYVIIYLVLGIVMSVECILEINVYCLIGVIVIKSILKKWGVVLNLIVYLFICLIIVILKN